MKSLNRGLASGVYNTSPQIDQATGIALPAALIALPDLETGIRIGLTTHCGLLGALILVLSLARVPRNRPRDEV